MAKRRKNFEYESPIPEEELSWRMGSTAGRKLEARLKSAGWTNERFSEGAEPDPDDQAST
jgi:hypothetical protein